MNDNNNQPDPAEHDESTTDTDTATGQQQDDEPRFTQAELEAKIANRLGRQKRAHQKELDEVNDKLSPVKH